MAAVAIDELETPVLQAYADMEKEDPEGAWAWYYHTIAESSAFAESIVKRLKKRGLLTTNDNRVNSDSSYWISDKGKEALDGAA